MWKVCGSFIYCVGAEGSDDKIEVPDGFLTDFASVPRVFWRIFPPTGKYGKAAVIHDYLYRFPQNRTRAECDLIFYEAMVVLGVGFVTRHTIYRAVCMCGWVPWRQHRRKRSR